MYPSWASQDRSKIDPKNRSNFRPRFCSVLAPILPPFWLPFSLFFAPGSLSNTYLLQKRRFLENSTKTNRKSTKMPLRHPSKTTQNRPKTAPRGNFFALKFRPRFGIDFGSILPPKMPPFWHPFGAQNRSKNRSEIRLFKKSLQDRPKTAQDRPRPLQDAPRTARELPGCPPGPPRTSQKASQEAPRSV